MPIKARRMLGVAAPTIALLAMGLLVSGWIFYPDDRLPSHSPMVGTLEIDIPEGRGGGTAFLIDNCGILTNFHVAFGPWYVTVLRPPSRKYSALFTLTEVELPDGTHPKARATPVVWGDFGDPYQQMMDAGEDWTYLVLDRCLGAKYGYFSLRAIDPDDFDSHSTRFSSIGYSAGDQMFDPSCSVQIEKGSRWGVWLHDCALMPGDSGGPIIKQGTLAAVALGASFIGGPGCPKVPTPARDLPSWANDTCANAAVPLTPALIDRIEAAQTAVAVQRLLRSLGYDSGQLGAIDEPPASAAIRGVERDMGWPVTGVPTEFLRKILMLRLPLS